jgi:hypothetical protein
MRLTAQAAAIAVALAIAGPPVFAQATYGTYEQPLEGRRYETMRALANYVDETAHDAYDAARDDARRGSRTARALTATLRSFARSAADFHDRLDSYEAAAVDVPDDVDTLVARARRIQARVRTGRGLSSMAQTWPDVMDGLDRMKRLLAGQDVEVPYGDTGSADYDRDYRPFGTAPTRPVVSGGLTGAQLEEFHQLAHAFYTAVSRAYEVAWRQQRNNPGGDAVLANLRALNQSAADVHQRADDNAIDPREARPIVDRLVADARQVDQAMRAQRVYTQLWDQWSSAMDIANQMAALVR